MLFSFSEIHNSQKEKWGGAYAYLFTDTFGNR